jgi:TorA maturation chaperone TorD
VGLQASIVGSDDKSGNLDSINSAVDAPALAEEDLVRAHYYGLLSRVLANPMSDQTLEILRDPTMAGDLTALGKALNSIHDTAIITTRSKAVDEFTALFHGMGSGGEVQPYLSFYLTGFVYEKPLARLRQDLSEIGVRSSGVSKEPEDHMAFICEVMNGLIRGSYNNLNSLSRQKAFFISYLAPWGISFFEDLEVAKSSSIYKPIGTLGKIFMAVEGSAFEMVEK